MERYECADDERRRIRSGMPPGNVEAGSGGFAGGNGQTVAGDRIQSAKALATAEPFSHYAAMHNRVSLATWVRCP